MIMKSRICVKLSPASSSSMMRSFLVIGVKGSNIGNPRELYGECWKKHINQERDFFYALHVIRLMNDMVNFNSINFCI